MNIYSLFRKHPNISCFLLIFLGFFLTSAGYLSWVYHVMDLVPVDQVDLHILILGYLAQALGIAFFSFFIRKKRERAERPVVFPAAVILFIVCLIPAVLSKYETGTLIYGHLMNLFCGIIAGYYLYCLAFKTTGKHNGLIFGGSYAAASVAAWLLSLVGGGNFLRSAYVLIVYAVLAALLILLVVFWSFGKAPGESSDPAADSREKAAFLPTERPSAQISPTPPYLLLAIGMICLLSLVKELGFGFSASDILSGVSIELSRIFYAAGLLIAGLISDKSRKAGAICALAGLIIPFVMIALSGEPVSVVICWALEYFFYGFFSVYRVLFFTDLANASGRWALAGFGLLFGRISDALGPVCNMLFGQNTLIMILAAVILFFAAVVLFFLLYARTYVPAPAAAEKTEEEIFEEFAISYDLSTRERAVLRCLIDAKTNAEIAEDLCVSESTVKFHVHNLLGKTGCKTRSEIRTKYLSKS